MPRFTVRSLICAWALTTAVVARAALPAVGNLSATNLVAWCIVPFDTKKRSPEERAAMLEKLGIQRLAYDWRAEHIPSFDAEVAALARRKIELTAWWFPAALNSEARAILDCLARHKLHPQLWVTMGTENEPDSVRLEAKRQAAVATLEPICVEAAKLGCTVGLYNHLGWFGEPTNQIQIIERLQERGQRNVGIVYNFHHAHAQIDRFPQLLRQMQPHLIALNLNGMVRDGDRVGRKIIPLATGTEELRMLQALQESGWKGPVGILGHTEEDAEVKLSAELAGLQKLVPQLDGARAAQSVSAANSTPALAASGRVVGEPAISGRDPGSQGEKDWVDNRWQETDVGGYLASVLPTPEGAIAKGLSIQVGEGDGIGGVAYDTAACALRAAWTGGFLRFSPSRFGLIEAPRMAGAPRLVFARGPGWLGATPRYAGHHRQGRQLVLEYDVDGTAVRELPAAVGQGEATVFTRVLELAPSSHPLQWVGATLRPAEAQSPMEVQREAGRVRVECRVGTNQLVAVFTGTATEFQRDETGRLVFTFPPANETRRVRLSLWQGPVGKAAEVSAALKDVAIRTDLGQWGRGGPSQWPALTTRGERGLDNEILAVDTLTAPYDNPWKALLFFAGVDVARSGAVYGCTIHGDVWRVMGVDAGLGRLEWKRFATGLFQPLGLKVRGDRVFVLGRDRITELLDNDGDGEADTYRSFCDLIDTSTGGHDYVTCLEQDNAGNFYYVDPKGVHRVSPDGRRRETLATGWRNPNGMGVSPDGQVITVAPQQGEWTPSSLISEVRPGAYYGYGGPKVTPERPVGYDPHLCWIPHSIDNSSGSQVWIPEGQWGPLGGQLLHLLWGRSGMMLVLRDAVDGLKQGAVVPLPARFQSGPNRASFCAADGCLYVGGSTGWQTNSRKDGSLHRVRFTGRTVGLPIGWHAEPNALVLRFTQPLDRATAEDPGSYGIKQWNYRYARDYGSKDWSVANPSKEGRDSVEVKSARLLPDGHSVRLEVPGLAPVMQMEVKYNVDTTGGGKPLRGQLWLSINRLGNPATN